MSPSLLQSRQLTSTPDSNWVCNLVNASTFTSTSFMLPSRSHASQRIMRWRLPLLLHWLMSLSRTLSEVIAGRRKDAGGRETRSQIQICWPLADYIKSTKYTKTNWWSYFFDQPGTFSSGRTRDSWEDLTIEGLFNAVNLHNDVVFRRYRMIIHSIMIIRVSQWSTRLDSVSNSLLLWATFSIWN